MRHENRFEGRLASPEAPIATVRASAYAVPTDSPEADGTFAWDSTTLVLAEVNAGGATGIGYTYADASIVPLIQGALANALSGKDAFAPGAAWWAMQRQVRNLGREGLAACAISALDAAIWDLKARLLDLPLARLLGIQRSEIPIYGSGGFTSYDDATLARQLAGWVADAGCRWVKMKIGTEPARDPERVRRAREAIGEAGLFVDANGAYGVKQALSLARAFADQGVVWFEEPVSSDDLEGLSRVRERLPWAIELAAGEYAYTIDYARRMLCAHAVDVLQADASRCGGITGFLAIGELCAAHHLQLSAHCAPALHLHAACAATALRHQEWFHDHVRIEARLFDGAPRPGDGVIRPDLSRPGLGLEFRRADAARFQVA